MTGRGKNSNEKGWLGFSETIHALLLDARLMLLSACSLASHSKLHL